MKALARAVINAAAFLELSEENATDPELALQALEEIGYNLSHCTGEEKRALAEAVEEMRAAELENGPRPEVLEFLNTFLTSFGLADAAELPEPETPRRVRLL